jgi:hypothetical protein
MSPKRWRSSETLNGLGGLLIQGGFELANGGEIGVLAAEEFDDLHGGTQGRQRVALEAVKRLDAADTGVGVFLEQDIKYGTGLLPIGAEFLSASFQALRKASSDV